jgi:hypothetical protein
MQKQRTDRLAQMIRAEVKAQMKRYAMSRTREEFINALNDVLGPALDHHDRVILAARNNRIDPVEKWQRQVDHFLRQFMSLLSRPTKAKGLDRRKAVEQSLKEIMQTDGTRRRIESLDFQRTYSLKTLTPLPDNAHEDFLARVREIVDIIFPS